MRPRVNYFLNIEFWCNFFQNLSCTASPSSLDLLLNQENQILSHQDKISILDAHPRLGAPKESLSALSYAEQGYNKSNSNNDNNNKEDDHHFQNVLDQLAHWNAEYEKKHGFKFVLFVNGRSRAEILPIIQVRFNNPTHVEMTTGLRDMCDIARDRLNKLNG